MSLRDQKRTQQAFEIDDAVKRILAAWAKERDSDVGRLNLQRAAQRLDDPQRAQLVARLAEISLGLLYVLEKGPTRPKDP